MFKNFFVATALEQFYFVNYILNLNSNFFIYYSNFFSLKIKYFNLKNLIPSSDKACFSHVDIINKKLFNKFNNFLLKPNLSNDSNWQFFNFREDRKTKVKIIGISKTKWLLSNIFFLFNYSIFNSRFKQNHNLSFFSILNTNGKVVVVNSQKLINRWKSSYDFIFNIFFFNLHFTIFSSSLFKKETLSLNWSSSNWSLGLWKFYSPFFVFQPNRYNKKIDFFFKKLKNLDISFYIVTDCLYHYKNLFYLKKNNNFTLGLVNFYDSPWVVSYPIITLFDNYLVQSFFFKLLIYLQKQALFLKFTNFKKTWKAFQLSLLLSSQ